MFWENPTFLLGLWILPALAWLLYYAHRQRYEAARRFVDAKMIARLMPAMSGARPWIKGGLLLLAIGLLTVAAARPRFGVYFEEVSARGVDLFVLLDVSRSMLAEDVAPNRLQRAKSDIRDLLKKLSGDRVGLIAFAGAPTVIVPLTTDHGFFQNALDDVGPDSAPRGGSLIGDAIRKAVVSLEQRYDRDQVIVLITDGEDHESFPVEAAKQAQERGIKIYTIGLGDPLEGARIPIRDAAGNLRFVKEPDGQEHWSKMDERTLKEVALVTGGGYVPAKTKAYDLGQIYEEYLAGLNRGEIQAEKRKRYADQFQLFLVLGLAVLFVEMLLPRYPRHARLGEVGSLVGSSMSGASRTSLEAGRPASYPPAQKVGVGSAGTLLLIVVAVSVVWSSSARGAAPQAARYVREGIDHYQRGDYRAAAQAFAEADVAQPDDPRIAFDQACALAAQGDGDKASELFQRAALARDARLVAEAHHNLGCVAATKAKAVFGEKPEEASPEQRATGLELLTRAVSHYRDCLDVNKQHAKARHNLEVLRLWIKHMQDVWSRRDRQQRREEMNLLEFLEMIQAEQESLRNTGRTLVNDDDSPKQRQAVAQNESAQRELATEIEPLKEKIQEALQPPQNNAGAAANQTPPVVPDAEKATKLLTDLADRAGRSMVQAADELADGSIAKAVVAQGDVLDALDDIYMAVAPFSHLLAKATAVQQELVTSSKDIVEQNKKGPEEQSSNTSVDYDELARDQSRVSRWSEILPPKAQQELQQLSADPNAPPPADPNQVAPQAEPTQEALKTALQKAIELGPKIHDLTREAANDLEKRQISDALPQQEEALKLLHEIAESLPKQPQDPNQGDSSETNKQDPSNQNESNRGEENQEQAQQRDLSRQQAETLLRRVREREQQHRQRQRELQQYLGGNLPVDKDW